MLKKIGLLKGFSCFFTKWFIEIEGREASRTVKVHTIFKKVKIVEKHVNPFRIHHFGSFSRIGEVDFGVYENRLRFVGGCPKPFQMYNIYLDLSRDIGGRSTTPYPSHKSAFL